MKSTCCLPVISSRILCYRQFYKHVRSVDSDESNRNSTTERTRHAYRTVSPWQTKAELIDELKSNILHLDENMVVLNKPYGLLNYGYPATRADRAKNYALYMGVAAADRFHLHGCIPELENITGLENLKIASTIDRFCSGPVILCTPSGSEQVEKLKSAGNLRRSYLALTVGAPVPPTRDTFGFVVRMDPLQTNRDLTAFTPVISFDYPKRRENRLKEGMIFVKCSYATLSSRHGAAVVRLQISKSSKNSIRLITSHMLSPILGDHIFGARVKHILGVPVPVSPRNRASEGPQELPEDLSTRLRVPKTNPTMVPLHLHNVSLSLKGSKRSLEIVAPPPAHFLYSLKALQLISDVGILKLLQLAGNSSMSE